MKSEIVVFLTIAVAFGSAAFNYTELAQNKAICKTENPMVDGDQKIMYLHKKGVLKDETDELARCYITCMMTRMGKYIDPIGTFNSTLAKQNVVENSSLLYGPPGTKPPPQAAVDAAVDQCKNITAVGKCMTTYKIWTCLYVQLHAATGVAH